jgi:cyclic pyranopterin phosphate synthase
MFFLSTKRFCGIVTTKASALIGYGQKLQEPEPNKRHTRRENKSITRINAYGEKNLAMVDVSDKAEIFREATATGTIKLKPETINLIKAGKIAKGDPLYTAKIAGVLAAKKTSSLIPLCHPLPLTNVQVDVKVSDGETVEVSATVKAKAQTGVEMEALAAVSMGLLTVWDMTKQYEKDAAGQYPSTAIENIHVVRKFKQV